MGKSLTFICCVISILSAINGQKEFDFIFDSEGAYALYINGKLWLENGPTFFNGFGRQWSTNDLDYPIVLRNVKTITGGDIEERWQERQLTYSLGDTNTTVIAAIRVYTNSIYTTTKVLFRQIFPDGLVDTAKGILSLKETISGFPCFLVKDPDEKLGFLSYGGDMFGNTDKHMSIFDSETENINDGLKGGPLALFNEAGNTVVISPYNNFMAASLWHDGRPGGDIAWGIMGGVNEIPANFTYSTLLVFSNGINEAFQLWGDQLQRQYGYSNWDERHHNVTNDISLNYLGYWTDNGAYYYYHREGNKTYEDTLLDVKKYSVDSKIPYRYLQLDSWWYPKDALNAVLTWTPMEGIFPNGIKNLSDKTEWPIAAHNRYWSMETPYAKQNGGNYTFIIGLLGSLPNDQDWLYVQTLFFEALQKNLILGRDWLTQMATAAAHNNQTIQYCMSYPRHALQSLELPVVTQARVSEDYLTGSDQWKVGVSSIFARAMRIQPSKDTFWTTTTQPGNPYKKTEPYPALEAAVASLTAGPVGPGDMINGTDRKLLMRCCTEEGKLLKPSRPATAIDKQIITDAFRHKTGEKIGEIWSTHGLIRTRYNTRLSMIDKDIEYGILFAADISGQFSVAVNELGFAQLTRGVYFPYTNACQWMEFDSSTQIDLTDCSKTDFCLYYFSPRLNITPSSPPAVLGETDKWIPMSEDRLQRIEIDSEEHVDLIFQRAPTIEPFNVSYIRGGEMRTRECFTSTSLKPFCRLG